MSFGISWSSAISVQGLSILLQRVNHVHRCHCFPLSRLCVHNRVSCHLHQHLVSEFPCWSVRVVRNPLNSTSSGQSSQSPLCHLESNLAHRLLDHSLWFALFSWFSHFSFSCHSNDFCKNYYIIVWVNCKLIVKKWHFLARFDQALISHKAL